MNTPSICLVTVAIIAGSCSMTNRAHSGLKNTVKAPDTLLVDRDGNTYHLKLLTDGNLWMTTNLRLSITNSYCYENDKQYCEKYGRLYTWESAKQGCALLGEGWRLPRTEEWRKLTVLYGGTSQDSTTIRKEAYKALLDQGDAGFNALLSGGRAQDSQYARIDAHGFYWAATERDTDMAWFANFAKGSQALYLQPDGEKLRAFAVRCLKSVSGLK